MYNAYICQYPSIHLSGDPIQSFDTSIEQFSELAAAQEFSAIQINEKLIECPKLEFPRGFTMSFKNSESYSYKAHTE